MRAFGASKKNQIKSNNMATPANTIAVIDYLLENTTTNEVHVKKVEILVPITSFEDQHVPKEVFTYLVENMRKFYICFGCLVIDRNIS